VIFKSSFVEQDGHGVLYRNGINVFEGIGGMCVAALAPAVMTISGSIFQPRATMLSISGWYLLVLASSVAGENLSLQYVNSINCKVIVWSIFVGVYFDMVIL
jgi:hypothetical protein